MRKWNNWIQQPSIGDGRMDFHSISQDLHVRDSGYLDSSVLNNRFILSGHPLNCGHDIAGVLPRLQCQLMTISPHCANSCVHKLSWSSTLSAIQSNGLYSVMGNQNPNTTDLSWRVPGTKINRFPHLRDYRGYMLCSPHLNTDRTQVSSGASKSRSFQLEQTSCSRYPDPVSRAPIQYLQRLSEMASLETYTIRHEDTKKQTH